jgi:hypothetical protein
MLDYALADYEAKDGNRSAFTNDADKNIHNDFHREGYVCFYKKISIDDTKLGDLQFPYRIKYDFVPSYTNNTIYCVVVKGQLKLEAFISFEFSSFGTNGTTYTLNISPLTN